MKSINHTFSNIRSSHRYNNIEHKKRNSIIYDKKESIKPSQNPSFRSAVKHIQSSNQNGFKAALVYDNSQR